MYKFAKISLVATLALAGLTSNALAADSLAEAFKNGKFKGEIKSYYFEKELEASGSEKDGIWVNGGNVSYVTDSFNGFRAGVEFQTSHTADYKNEDNGGYDGDMDGSGSVMSEAYIGYKIDNTDIKVGRQHINLPLVRNSGSRMIKESFEAALITNTDISDTKLVVGFVDKMLIRTDGSGDIGSFSSTGSNGKHIGDGLTTLYVKNNSIENLTIQAQYAGIEADEDLVTDDQDLFYADFSYKINPVTTFAVQTYQSDNGTSGDSDGKLYGAKITTKVAGFGLYAAYTTTDDEANVLNGVGFAAVLGYAGSPILSGLNSYTADTDSFKLGVDYKFNSGLKIALSHSQWDMKASDIERTESSVVASYGFSKQLSAKIIYSKFDEYTYDYRSRYQLSYKF